MSLWKFLIHSGNIKIKMSKMSRISQDDVHLDDSWYEWDDPVFVDKFYDFSFAIDSMSLYLWNQIFYVFFIP